MLKSINESIERCRIERDYIGIVDIVSGQCWCQNSAV